MKEFIKHSNLKLNSDFGDIIYDIYEPICKKYAQNRVIQIAHGMVEHRKRYEWLAGNLAKMGYIVVINDHRGHGESISRDFGQKISLGEMGENGFERAVRDLYELNRILIYKFENPKLILLGHSMGSLLSRRFMQLYPNNIDALILSGTPANNSLLTFGIYLAKFFKFIKFKGGSKIINSLSFGSFNKKFSKDSKFGWLCSEKSIVDSYMNDPLCSFIFSLQSFINLFEGTKTVYGKYPLVKNANFPILFISGSEDSCGNFGKGVQDAREHLIKQGYKNVEIILYPEARHEVFNDIKKKEALEDMLKWLDSAI